MIPAQAKLLITSIETTGKKLSSKEKNFLRNIKKQVNEGKYLREAQSKWLTDICDRVNSVQEEREYDTKK